MTGDTALRASGGQKTVRGPRPRTGTVAQYLPAPPSAQSETLTFDTTLRPYRLLVSLRHLPCQLRARLPQTLWPLGLLLAAIPEPWCPYLSSSVLTTLVGGGVTHHRGVFLWQTAVLVLTPQGPLTSTSSSASTLGPPLLGAPPSGDGLRCSGCTCLTPPNLVWPLGTTVLVTKTVHTLAGAIPAVCPIPSLHGHTSASSLALYPSTLCPSAIRDPGPQALLVPLGQPALSFPPLQTPSIHEGVSPVPRWDGPVLPGLILHGSVTRAPSALHVQALGGDLPPKARAPRVPAPEAAGTQPEVSLLVVLPSFRFFQTCVGYTCAFTSALCETF